MRETCIFEIEISKCAEAYRAHVKSLNARHRPSSKIGVARAGGRRDVMRRNSHSSRALAAYHHLPRAKARLAAEGFPAADWRATARAIALHQGILGEAMSWERFMLSSYDDARPGLAATRAPPSACEVS